MQYFALSLHLYTGITHFDKISVKKLY